METPTDPISAPDLSVCVLSWNTRALLRRCLASIYDPEDSEVEEALARAGLLAARQPAAVGSGERSLRGAAARASPGADGNLEVEILVVDNASGDRSAEMVAEQFPQVRLHRSPKNLGFPGGNNVGYRLSRGRYFLLLNSDTVVAPGAFAELVRFADANPQAGIVGPRVLNPDGSLQMSCRRFPTLGAGLFRNTPLGRLFPKNRFTRDYLMTDWDHHVERPVDWVSGCCLLARRQMVEEIGLLDEGYFMYCEDVDWAYRAGQAGWQVLRPPRRHRPRDRTQHRPGGVADDRSVSPLDVSLLHPALCRHALAALPRRRHRRAPRPRRTDARAQPGAARLDRLAAAPGSALAAGASRSVSAPGPG
jgi:GT2 family glycosyltransferase